MIHLQQNTKQIKLYDYQKTAFKKTVAALKETFRALVVMATGLGKTILSIAVVKHFITPRDKVLFLCHDNGILNKTFKDYREHFDDSFTMAKFYGQKKDWEADKHHFVFATFQSIHAHLNNEKSKEKLFSPEHFAFIVVDESHHSQAETFAEVINYFTPKYRLGLTATPEREDGMDISEIFGEPVVNIRLAEAIANNWLTKVHYKVLTDGLDAEKIREVCKEVLEDNIRLTEKQINERIFIKARTEAQCEIIQEYSGVKKPIVFCKNITHLKHVISILPSSVGIHSEQSETINTENFTMFENGLVRYLTAVDKLNEGIDIPECELLAFLRVTGSRRIFEQQLGRGLRITDEKETLVVLDFVANIDRVRQIHSLVKEIEFFRNLNKQEKSTRTENDSFHIEGTGFQFDFSDQVMDLISILERIEKDFYPTWQEASKAAIGLGINLVSQYPKLYKKDQRLPSDPTIFYKDSPVWTVFLGKKVKEIYPTWQKASKAAIGLGAKSRVQYKKLHKKDPRLPSNPNQFYKKNWPGWVFFLGKKVKEIYPTWQKASKAAIGLGAKSLVQYRKIYKQDKKLPHSPEAFYKDWPGWVFFLGKKLEKTYPTWQKASKAAIGLGAKSLVQYKKLHKKDPRLPSNPNQFYKKNWPGWKKFLGKE